jgi:hypothetical protein
VNNIVKTEVWEFLIFTECGVFVTLRKLKFQFCFFWLQSFYISDIKKASNLFCKVCVINTVLYCISKQIITFLINVWGLPALRVIHMHCNTTEYIYIEVE